MLTNLRGTNDDVATWKVANDKKYFSVSKIKLHFCRCHKLNLRLPCRIPETFPMNSLRTPDGIFSEFGLNIISLCKNTDYDHILAFCD